MGLDMFFFFLIFFYFYSFLVSPCRHLVTQGIILFCIRQVRYRRADTRSRRTYIQQILRGAVMLVHNTIVMFYRLGTIVLDYHAGIRITRAKKIISTEE